MRNDQGLIGKIQKKRSAVHPKDAAFFYNSAM